MSRPGRYLLLALLLAIPGVASGATNSITIRERGGVTTTNYPIQIGRPFVQGEISSAPQAVVNGTPVETQADVKTRWPDGSVKHAILCFYIPTLSAGGQALVTFRNQTAPTGGGLSAAQMLGSPYNFDAVIELTNGTVRSASARAMLTAGVSSDWLRGPVVTSIILADHSQARAYDIGFDANRAFRPIFHATFWPQIGKVRVRYIGEIANTEALEDQSYSLRLTLGSSSPSTVYTKSTFTHCAAARWTREFWIGGAPPPISIDHNLAYVASTYQVPNYDTRKVISESALAAEYSQWTASSRDIYGNGGWNPYMPTTGGREDIGPYPGWTVRWLYTGDARAREEAFGNADLAAAWPMHYREGDPAKLFTRDGAFNGLGRVLSLTGRPTLEIDDFSLYMTTAADKIVPTGTMTNGGWSPDGAHQPDPFSAQYLLSGDYWYLEECYFWASWTAARPLPGIDPNGYYGRGPTGAEGGINDQVRGQAWALRSRAQTAVLAPDGSAEKQYFNQLVLDAISRWEGVKNITGTSFTGTPLWNWGQLTYAIQGPAPLHDWDRGSTAHVDASINPAICYEAQSPFEFSLMMFALGRARELGYPADALVAWQAVNIIGQLTSPDYNPYLISRYRIPETRVSDHKYFTTWAEKKSGYVASAVTEAESVFRDKLTDPDHGYSLIALTGAAYVADQPGGAAAWSFMEREALVSPYLNDNPKWAIIPRSVVAGPTDTTAPSRVGDLRPR